LLGNEEGHYEWVKRLADRTGRAVVGLTNLDSYSQIAASVVDTVPYDATPLDFVRIIMNAEYICTDSFHATMFSLMFHKKFFVFKRFINSTKMSTNGRLDSIFRRLNINDPFTKIETPLDKALSACLDYENIDKDISSFRDISALYLREALDI
jgi:hypothetical protein